MRVLDGRVNVAGVTGKTSAGVSSYELLENMSTFRLRSYWTQLAGVSSKKLLGTNGERFVLRVTGNRFAIVSSQELLGINWQEFRPRGYKHGGSFDPESYSKRVGGSIVPEVTGK